MSCSKITGNIINMKIISSEPKYTNRFITHLAKFVEKYKLFSPEDELLLGVSGGLDSMVLLTAIWQLKTFGYSNRIRVVNINHGTRVEQADEALMVKSFCDLLKVEFQEIKLTKLNEISNFENTAREKRYESFYAQAKVHEKIVLAHHIDDSFEWTLLQSLRSSSIEGLIGIPLINDRVIRPLMCVTKAQITRFARCFDIPFLEDPTNDQIKYERNFLRHEVISAFKNRYPKYLKHYVHRHNEIARRLGYHLYYKHQSSFNISKAAKSVLIYNKSVLKDLSGLEDLIMQGVKHLNPKMRGTLHNQLEKIKQALLNDKSGPLLLSGGLRAYLDFNIILLTKEADKLKLKATRFEELTFDEFSQRLDHLLLDKSSQLCFPFIIEVQGSFIDKRKFDTSFNKEITQALKSKNRTYYPALKLLRQWSKKRNRHKSLRLSFYLN